MPIYMIGIITGIISGMAMGGGTFLIVALVFFTNISQHVAQGVSLASFLPTAVVAIIVHFRQGNIKVKLALLLIAGSLCGAIVGAILATKLETALLRKIFGFYLIGTGGFLLWQSRKTPLGSFERRMKNEEGRKK